MIAKLSNSRAPIRARLNAISEWEKQGSFTQTSDEWSAESRSELRRWSGCWSTTCRIDAKEIHISAVAFIEIACTWFSLPLSLFHGMFSISLSSSIVLLELVDFPPPNVLRLSVLLWDADRVSRSRLRYQAKGVTIVFFSSEEIISALSSNFANCSNYVDLRFWLFSFCFLSFSLSKMW